MLEKISPGPARDQPGTKIFMINSLRCQFKNTPPVIGKIRGRVDPAELTRDFDFIPATEDVIGRFSRNRGMAHHLSLLKDLSFNFYFFNLNFTL